MKLNIQGVSVFSAPAGSAKQFNSKRHLLYLIQIYLFKQNYQVKYNDNL